MTPKQTLMVYQIAPYTTAGPNRFPGDYTASETAGYLYISNGDTLVAVYKDWSFWRIVDAS